MIVIGEKTITESEKGLLKNDFTGYNVVLYLKSREILKEHSSFHGDALEQFPGAWKISTDGRPMLWAYLINRIDWGEFQDSTYECIVQNSNGSELSAWSIVTIDSQHRSGEWNSEQINLNLFGFYNYSQKKRDPYTTEDYKLWFRDRVDADHLSRLKAQFTLFPGAALYHKLQYDKTRRQALIEELEVVENIVSDLSKLRNDSRKHYSEISYWKEWEFRKRAEELRKEIFSDVYGIFRVEYFWYTYLQSPIRRKTLIVESGITYYFRNRKLSALDEIQEGELYCTLDSFDDLYSVRMYLRTARDTENKTDSDESQLIEAFQFGLKDNAFPETLSQFLEA
jgi:hypothetical protein